MWTSLLKALPALISLISVIWRTLVSAKDRALGRAEATAEALRRQAEQNKLAVDAVNRAEAEHAKYPDSDDAFDRTFERKD